MFVRSNFALSTETEDMWSVKHNQIFFEKSTERPGQQLRQEDQVGVVGQVFNGYS